MRERLDQDMRKDDERQRSEEAASHLAGRPLSPPVFSASLSRSSSHYVHFFPHHIRVADGSAPRATRSDTTKERGERSEGAPPYGLRHE